LVARGLWHILQHAQPLLNRLPAVLRQLLPLRQDLIADVLALFRPQLIPHLRALLQFLPLRGRQVLQPSIVVQDLLLFLWAQVIEFSPEWRSVRRWRPIRIETWSRRRLRAIHVRVRRTVRARILPLVLRSQCFLLLLLLPPLLLSLLLPRRLLSRRLPRRLLALLFWRLIVLSILRPIRSRSLRERRHSRPSAHCQRHQPSRELESSFHCCLHLLILVCAVFFFGLHRLRQIRQRREIRQNIKILQHRQVLVYLFDFTRIQRRVRRSRPNPHHRQYQHRRRERHSRRRRVPCPPALLRRLRRRTRTSNAADGSIIGNSSSNTFTARNSFTRNWHAAHVPRCFSISRRSPSFRRPSTYPIIFFSIPPQFMTSFPSWPTSTASSAAPRICSRRALVLLFYICLPLATSGASSTRSVSYARKSSDFSALSEHPKIVEISP